MHATECRLELCRELASADQSGAVQTYVQIAEDVSRLETSRPFLKRVEMTGRIGPADDRADRRADDDIGHDTVCQQCAHNADVSEAARGTAPQRQPNGRSLGHSICLTFAGRILPEPHPILQHRQSPW